jgi:hypothetical protein
MKRALLLAGAAWLAGAAGAQGVAPNPLPTMDRGAAHAVAAALGARLDAHRLVAIGESHRSSRFHRFLDSILADPALICRADDIVVEFGNGRFQDVADSFVSGRPVAAAEKEKIWRDTGQFLVWDSPLYEHFFDLIRAINAKRLCDHPIRVLLGDPPIDWGKVAASADYGAFAERDLWFADVVEREVLAKGRRALLIAGAAHVLKGRPSEFTGRPSMAEIIEHRHPGLVFSVLPVADADFTALTAPAGGSFLAVGGSALASQSYQRLASPRMSARVIENGKPVWRPMSTLSWPAIDRVIDAVVKLTGEDHEVRPDPSVYADLAWQAELKRRAAILSQFYGSDFLPELAEAMALAPTEAAPPAGPPPSPAAAAPAPAPADVAVTREEARQVAAELARKIAENYVFPDVAARYAEMLRTKAGSGAYDGFSSGRALAAQLTADLRALSPDAHLRVRVGPPDDMGRRVVVVGSPGAGAAPPQPARPAFPFKPIEEARWLAPGIAYIRFNIFPGDPDTVAAARAFMADHADARVIIFDNRTHHGGGLAEMNAMFPYLFARPATLVTMDTRASVDRAQGSHTDEGERRVPAKGDIVRREHVVVPSRTEKRLFGAKVFVLTSGATASAAEHFTLALKHTHRATIVGEPTAGAGHYGGFEAVGDKFSVFIPVGRSSDPDTGKDWEGVGIEPDVAVPAEQALTRALVLSALPEAEAERISAEVKPSQPMTRRIPRVLPPGGRGI